MKLMVGSQALRIWGDKYIAPDVKRAWDTDVIGSYEEYEKYKASLNVVRMIPTKKGKVVILFEKDSIHEFEIAWSNSVGSELLDIVRRDELLSVRSGDSYIASPDLVYTLKMSHRYLKDSPHFLKTMQDIHHLRSVGCSIPDSLREWYGKRKEETYWYAHPKLKDVTKGEFFKDDAVPYKYDHDTIHLAVKHMDQPAYNYFKPDTSEVHCSREMFDECPDEVKLLSVLEESYVLALERSQIPAPGAITPEQSFLIALSKVCTSITSGWWREFAWENYFRVKNMYSDSYIDKFKEGVQSGLVKEHCV